MAGSPRRSFDPLFVIPRSGGVRFEHAVFVPDERSAEALAPGDIERFWLEWSVERYTESDGRFVLPRRVVSEPLNERAVYLAPRVYLSDDSHRARKRLLTEAQAFMEVVRRAAFEFARRRDAPESRVDAYGLEVAVEAIEVPEAILGGRFGRGLVYGYAIKPTAYALYGPLARSM